MWTETRKATAKQRWLEGKSATEIAMELGGVSRNAVIGMIHRSSMQRSRPTPARTPRPRIPRARKVNKVRHAEKPARVEPLNVPFLDTGPGMCSAVTDTTQWEQRCCGHPVDARGTYCAAHRAIFYTPAKAKAR